MILNWKTTKQEMDLILTINSRIAVLLSGTLASDYAGQMAIMDLTAVHANGCPLDLSGLAQADEFDFSHDILGIRRHLNRRTGKLEDCFVPRYAKSEIAEVRHA